ncbi:MAG TPA: cyclase family protein [Candidatus Binataceae bacterium]|jgi:kynurenine formamidase
MNPRLASEELRRVYDAISNWGTWGKDDERGALNYITDSKRAEAARLVQSGEAVSMALPLATSPAPDNESPVTHLMIQADAPEHGVGGCADYFAISHHGFMTTHLDALCHIFWNGRMYNGFGAGEVGFHGARKCAIDVARQGIISRGVLLDITRVKKVEWMEPGERVFPEDLDQAEKDQKVRVGEGDVLLVRVGRARRRKVKGGWEPAQDGVFPMAGLDPACLPWLHDRKVALLGSDGVSDVFPSGYDDIPFPIHVGAIAMMGIHLLDNADLDELGAVCARLGRYEFQFVMSPLVLTRGTASPVNPVAIF